MKGRTCRLGSRSPAAQTQNELRFYLNGSFSVWTSACLQVLLTPPILETSVRPRVNCHDYSSISKWITIKHLTYTRARRLTELPCVLLLTSHPSCRGQILPARLLGLLWSLRCRGRRRGPWSRPDQTPLCGPRLLRNLLQETNEVSGNAWLTKLKRCSAVHIQQSKPLQSRRFLHERTVFVMI